MNYKYKAFFLNLWYTNWVGDSMPFRIERNDITKISCDAIVNTANPAPIIGNGTDTAIYQAAGEDELLQARKHIGPIARGQAAATPSFKLKKKQG